MPWCDDCAAYFNPNSLTPDGACPTCGRRLVSVETAKPAWRTGDRPTPGTPETSGGQAPDALPDGWHPNDLDTSIPWHFWVFVAALVAYLGWRLLQFLQWLFG